MRSPQIRLRMSASVPALPHVMSRSADGQLHPTQFVPLRCKMRCGSESHSQ